MRALIQRVSRGSVSVEGEIRGQIAKGFVVLLGVGCGDEVRQADWLAEKVANLRVFEDEQGKMNLSLVDVAGEALVVSQFTLFADCRKGRRPSFTEAARPDQATELYQRFVTQLRNRVSKVETGVFQTHMEVELINDGPVTLWLDTDQIGS